MVFPLSPNYGRAESACGVHGRSGEGATEQNVERDRETDAEWAEITGARIHCGSIYHESQKKREHCFDADTLEDGRALAYRRCAFEYELLPRHVGAIEQHHHGPRGHDRAEQLRAQ